LVIKRKPKSRNETKFKTGLEIIMYGKIVKMKKILNCLICCSIIIASF